MTSNKVEGVGCGRGLNPIAAQLPSIATGIRFYPLGSDQIAYVSESNAVVYLNPTARKLLALCDGQRRADEICRALAEEFGLTPDELSKDVASTLGCLAVEKLIHVESSILEDLASSGDDGMVVSQVRFGENTLRVQTTCKNAAAELRERFRQLLSPPTGQVSLSVDIIPISGSANEYVYIHTRAGNSYPQFFLKGNLDSLKPALVGPFMAMATDCAWFHAGAVAKKTSSIIVSGITGSGKSNITAELCRRGWDYLSDEVLPVSIPQLQTLPFPMTPLPRRTKKDLLPDHRLWEIERDSVELPDGRISKCPTTPKAIFLPCYSPGSGARLEPVTSGIAATELLKNCISLLSRPAQAIEVVTRLLEDIRALKLEYDDVPAACDQIEVFVEERLPAAL